jgi:hypothetical protein
MDNKNNNSNNYQDHCHEHGDGNPVSVVVMPPKRGHSPAPTGITSSLKWNQHPVIATVLWILGSTENGIIPALGKSQSESESGSSNGKSGVLWKDEHGGNIVEFVSQVQRSGEHMDGLGTQLYPRSLEEQRRRQTQDGNNNGDSNNEIVDASPSPQWGFYIPITPPQQEMFSVIKRDLMSIQSNQRTNMAGGPGMGGLGKRS